MHQDKWIFYTDLFGSQRWEKLDSAGLVIAESSVSFDTLAAALGDALRCGYVADGGSAAGALEWRREAVASMLDQEHAATD